MEDTPGSSAPTKLDVRIELGFLLSEVSRLLRLAYDKEMQTIDLTRSQWHALVYVLRKPGLSQTELADALEIARPSVGGLVDQLEKAGFIKRQKDENDRRVWRLQPTEIALTRVEALSRAADLVTSTAFRKVSDEQLNATFNALIAIRNNLTA
jgi:DNA-binding MarR family transcriptional regulator